MALYLTNSLHVSIAKAGIVMALFGAGAICGGLLGGKLTDKLGFYNIQLTALLTGGIMFILVGQMKSYTGICITTFILSLLNDSFRPANSTAIAHYSKEENRTRSYSLNRLAINLGWAVGGALGGFIASRNYHLLFWIDGLTNIGAALLLRAVLAPARNSQTPGRKQVEIKEKGPSAYKDKVYIAFIVFTILYASCFFQLFATIPLFFNKILHLSPLFIGMTMSINGLLIVLFEMIIVFRFEGKKDSLLFISAGTVLVGVSYLIFNLFPGFALLALISTFIHTLGEIFSFPFMNSFWVSRTKSSNRGQYAGLYTVAWSTAQVLGPALGAQIAQQYGFTVLWWLIAATCLIAAVGFRWLYHYSHRNA
jgi:predicted MFS family arabinose efflux permease